MKDLLRFCTSGSVDDGKSTLLGRLLFETGSVPEDTIEAARQSSKKRGQDDIDLSLLLDGLESEREQRITIDVAYRYFETPKRRFIVADTPGHEQYTRNMVTGASNSDLAIILIDARKGVQTQSKRHGFINSLLNISHLIVAINKMDLVGWSEEAYTSIVKEYREFSKKLNIQNIQYVPISALHGDNICRSSDKSSWYQGQTILELLESIDAHSSSNTTDFRFPVQSVLRPNQDTRLFAGRVASGIVRCGDDIVALPSGQKAKVTSVKLFNSELSLAHAGDSISIGLDREIDISRGEMIVHESNLPATATELRSVICWLSEIPLANKQYRIKHTTRKTVVWIKSLQNKIDVNTLEHRPCSEIQLNDIFTASLETAAPLFLDTYASNRETGSFILIDPDTNNTVACGMVEGFKKRSGSNNIFPNNLGKFTGSKGKVIWLTGLSGSGKSTIAKGLWNLMTHEGHKVVNLDGDNLRNGLCRDLGFSMEDRIENIRRISEVAKLFSQNGIHVITSLISPTVQQRKTIAEAIIEPDHFREVYVSCPLDVCEKRDTKGLYERARAGEIPDFTGIGSPYEVPASPFIKVETDKMSLDDCVKLIYSGIFDDSPE